MSAYGLGRRSARKPLLYGSSSTDTEREPFESRLVAFIPGDIVAGYVAILGLLPEDEGAAARWITSITFALLAPLVVVAVSRGRARQEDWRLPWFSAVASFVAFWSWVFALPESPFESLWTYDGWLRTLVLIATAVALPNLALLFKDDAATSVTNPSVGH